VSGHINGPANYPLTLGNDTSAGTDADEFVDAAGGDYRVKYGSTIWGKGYGVSDEPNPGGGGGGSTVTLMGVGW
jgi:hypothetical protein